VGKEREVRNGKGKREGGDRGSAGDGGRVGMSNGISPEEDKSKEKSEGDPAERRGYNK
jgi:hypothetical protein